MNTNMNMNNNLRETRDTMKQTRRSRRQASPLRESGNHHTHIPNWAQNSFVYGFPSIDRVKSDDTVSLSDHSVSSLSTAFEQPSHQRSLSEVVVSCYFSTRKKYRTRGSCSAVTRSMKNNDWETRLSDPYQRQGLGFVPTNEHEMFSMLHSRSKSK